MIIKLFEKADPTDNPLYREIEKLKMRCDDLENKIANLNMALAFKKPKDGRSG